MPCQVGNVSEFLTCRVEVQVPLPDGQIRTFTGDTASSLITFGVRERIGQPT